MPPRPNPTHFLCIPLGGPQLARALSSFRADVTNATTFGLPDDAVRPFGTLHLTLGIMDLRNDGLQRAVALLKSLKLRELRAECSASSKPATSPQLPDAGDTTSDSKSNLSISLRGLHSMQPAAKATVLYAPPSDSQGVLYEFCKRVRQPFRDAELMIDDGRPLLLHATIVNTIYVKNGGNRGRGGKREKLTIDARELLNRYDDFVWADDIPVTRVAICRMGAKQIEGTDDAAYEVEAEIAFDS